MSMRYYRLLGQLFVAAKSWEMLPDVKEAMSQEGITRDDVDEALSLVEKGESLVQQRRDLAGGDRIAVHAIHTGAEELEMWFQTVKMSLRSKVGSDDVMNLAVDHHIHSPDHTTTVVAGTLRTQGVLRTNDEIAEGYGARRQSLRDLIMRGQTLFAKLMLTTEDLTGDTVTSRSSDIFAKMEEHRQDMAQWLSKVSRAAEALRDRPEVLGLVGYLPEGVGIPSGGGSFAVPLHKRAQREAPDPSEKGSTSGWSIGRQGRNRENLGGGFVDPNFE